MYRKIRIRELRERYAAGERNFAGYTVKSGGDEFYGDFTGINLVNARLDEAYMEGIIFRDTDLRSAVLVDCCLNAADLTNADLRGCDLRGAKFGAANLTGADLRDAIFNNTDFYGANLTNANFSGVTLNASLRNAIFLNTIMPDGSIRTSTL
ncbi:pentapeptide repeat-containing protein [Chamaesiphon sp.]|uniref:pentapeptide repeat-containing protein n=1 Tax=Chamaesiphon sp. TaxID=2814140 RepID=UPI003592F55F